MIEGILMDLDGVIIDTEPAYDPFWREIAKRYDLQIENFESVIKGMIMPEIMSRYFAHLDEQEKECIIRECSAFEMRMPLIEVPGSLNFIRRVSRMDVPLALVTSSDRPKVDRVFKEFSLDRHFDVVITRELITKGKPSPDCYVLAAEKLDIEPCKCLVFEDSFNGIKAARSAGCRVVGVATTNPHQELIPLAFDTVSHFEGVSDAQLDHWGLIE